MSDSPLGRMLIAATDRGICAINFANSDDELEQGLRHEFPFAVRRRDDQALGARKRALLVHMSGPQSKGGKRSRQDRQHRVDCRSGRPRPAYVRRDGNERAAGRLRSGESGTDRNDERLGWRGGGVEDREHASAAVQVFRRGSIGFSDALIAEINRAHGCEATATFDRKAVKTAGFIAVR